MHLICYLLGLGVVCQLKAEVLVNTEAGNKKNVFTTVLASFLAFYYFKTS